MPTATLDPTLVVDKSHELHIVFQIEEPHKDYFVWRGRLCDCEEGCLITAGFGYMPKEPWTKLSVLIPSALRPGGLVTYCYSNDPEEVAKLIHRALHEEHRKGCVLPRRIRKVSRTSSTEDTVVVRSPFYKGNNVPATQEKTSGQRDVRVAGSKDAQPRHVGDAPEEGSLGCSPGRGRDLPWDV